MGSLSALTEHRALVIQLNHRGLWVGIYLLQIYLFSKVEGQSLNTLRLLPLSQISLQEILSILDWTIHFFSSHPPPTGSYTVWLWAHDTLSSAVLVLGFHVYTTTLASCSALFLESLESLWFNKDTADSRFNKIYKFLHLTIASIFFFLHCF